MDIENHCVLYDHFIQNIKNKMVENKIRSCDLAKKVGVTPGRISQILNVQCNVSNISIKTMTRIAKGVGCNLKISLEDK